jgi:hypothetical protein
MKQLDQLSDYKLLKEDLQLTGILQDTVMFRFKVIYIVLEVNHEDFDWDSNCATTERSSSVLPIANQLDFILT